MSDYQRAHDAITACIDSVINGQMAQAAEQFADAAGDKFDYAAAHSLLAVVCRDMLGDRGSDVQHTVVNAFLRAKVNGVMLE